MFVFFFQAEDGIRDIGVTGVQTCALPICPGVLSKRTLDRRGAEPHREAGPVAASIVGRLFKSVPSGGTTRPNPPSPIRRSEERRVGKECRSRWSPYH